MHGITRTGRRLFLVALTSFLAVSPALLSACKQGENERCQIDDDCATDYYCYYSSGNDKIIGGTCRSRTATSTILDLSTASPEDLSSAPDMAAADM